MPPFREGPLAPENLTHIAPQMRLATTVDQNGARPLTPEEFAGYFLGPGPAGLPPLVEAFLLRARECMAYGAYHYPLVTIGLGQLGLTAEAALRAHADTCGVPTRTPKGHARNMATLIKDLHDAGHLTGHQAHYWQQVAKLRNYLFHPDECPVLPLGGILPHLTLLTEALLELFPEAHFQDLPGGT
ncbi:hypothetical protein ACFSR9_11955 [Deinococcus taklimakanensis]|uniref:DUF4145 domain-containing protein n=1 Tax=Deinococcus taklimakanensis TaxID=536443 RepID=A0ABW5P4I4_9DEIO